MDNPTLVTGLLLLALHWLRHFGLAAPNASEVLQATGVSRTQGYRMKGILSQALPAYAPQVGRPQKPAPPDPPSSLSLEVLQFLYKNPGAVYRGPKRMQYSDAYRRFIIGWVESHREQYALPTLAKAAALPEETLRSWMRVPPTSEPSDATTEPPEPGDFPTDRPLTTIEMVLWLYDTWAGDFLSFCRMAREQWRLPYGRDAIRDILRVYRRRKPRRRKRSPDLIALKEAFETFFPNCQCVADGTQLTIQLWGKTYTVNVEFSVDAHTGAFVGYSVRAEEDAQAVIEAFESGVETAGEPPLALLLDNKSCNHSQAVQDAVGDTMLLHATPGRPENKAHVEGGFGLFKNTVPPLQLTATTAPQLAQQIVELIVQTWARATNHKPRGDRDGKSRFKLFQETPTQEEIAAALKALRARLRRLRQAQKTLAERQDPAKRAWLAQAFERLGIDDPKGYQLTAMATYPFDAVVEGISIYEAKLKAGTLPDDLDKARYLLGIIRNVAQDHEAWAMVDQMLDDRLKAREQALAPLVREHEALQRKEMPLVEYVVDCTDLAMRASRIMDRFFWLKAVAIALREQSQAVQRHLFQLAARRIQAVYRVKYRDRSKAIRFLASRIQPLG